MSSLKRFDCIMRCLEPVHVGTGEYRLDRVDNSIVREPSTGVPKIPATSIAGAYRSYASDRSMYGNSNQEEQRISDVRFSDARIVLFPIRSNKGTVYITTTDILRDYSSQFHTMEDFNEDKLLILRNISGGGSLSLGWLYLETEDLDNKAELDLDALTKGRNYPVGAVSRRLFNALVNDNLEVRTSVKIDDDTGTAKKGGLFTYEAIPRGTLLHFSLSLTYVAEAKIEEHLNNIKASEEKLRILGIGGLTTRGFGRVDVTRNEKREGE